MWSPQSSFAFDTTMICLKIIDNWTPESSYQGVTQLKVQFVFPFVMVSFIGIEIVLKAMVDISIVNKTSQQAIETVRQVDRYK